MTVTVRHMEGFHDDRVPSGVEGWTENPTYAILSTQSHGRNVPGCLRVTSTADTSSNYGAAQLGINGWADQGTRLIVQFGFRPVSLLNQQGYSGSYTTQWSGFFNLMGSTDTINGSSTDTISLICDNGACILAQGRGTAAEGTAGTLSTQTDLFSLAQWSFIEMNVLPGLGGAGRVSVRINGRLVFDEVAMSVDPDYVRLYWPYSLWSSTMHNEFDDLVIATSDQATVEWLGDCTVAALDVSGDGSETDGHALGSDGGPMPGAVQAGDPRYSILPSVGDRQSFTVDSSGLPVDLNSVVAVQARFAAGNPVGGGRTVKPLLKLGGAELVDTARALPADPTYVAGDVHETKPGGGSFTVADLASLEIGVEIA